VDIRSLIDKITHCRLLRYCSYAIRRTFLRQRHLAAFLCKNRLTMLLPRFQILKETEFPYRPEMQLMENTVQSYAVDALEKRTAA